MVVDRVTTQPATARVRAPQLTGAGWLNTPTPLTLASVRGRFVLLDFWTFCCANCLHVIDELRPLERKYHDILTVIGVHSPKFAHEAEPPAVAAAVDRYEVRHPVLLDPELRLWQQYAVRAWPTLVLIDPEGYVVAQAAGEGQVPALDAMLAALVAEHEARGTLRRGDAPPLAPREDTGTLRFPAKAVLLPAQRTGRSADSILVADSGHHQLVELDRDAATELRRIGTGRRGRSDGSAETASFAEPNGVALLPAGVAPYDVVVADTANHVLRGVRLSDGAVVATIDLPRLLADARTVTGAIPDVLSPWDVAWWPALNRLVVAAAGVHLLLSVELSGTPTAQVLAGTTVEGLRDGTALDAWLAQPSGLAVDGDRLWFVDAETSALRSLTIDEQGVGVVHDAVGEGLFDFGLVDGAPNVARMQHPLGVALDVDGSVLVLDTYNGAVRRWDGTALSTVATRLAEPSGALFVDGDLVVVESAAHRLSRPEPITQAVSDTAMHTHRPATAVAAGGLTVRVTFTPPPGRALDERYGPATQLTISASPPELLRAGAGPGTDLTRAVELDSSVPAGVLHVSAQAASCDKDPAIAHPACYLARQDWGVPVTVSSDGAAELELTLLG